MMLLLARLLLLRLLLLLLLLLIRHWPRAGLQMSALGWGSRIEYGAGSDIGVTIGG